MSKPQNTSGVKSQILNHKTQTSYKNNFRINQILFRHRESQRYSARGDLLDRLLRQTMTSSSQ